MGLNERMSAASRQLSKLYRDRCDIYVMTPGENASGTDDNADQLRLIASNIECKVSKSGFSKPLGEDRLTQEYDAVLFMDNGVDVPIGAKIVVHDVNGNSTTYRRATRQYSAYATHQEIAMMFGENYG